MTAEQRRLRIWALAPVADAREVAGQARTVEAQGWDGLMFPDNQNLWGDTFVSMTVAAVATSRLLLSNSATNSGTRHPAVLASAIAAVNQVADGRATLGIGRGDSALAHIGAAPVSVADFTAYIEVVRRLLHGRSVPFDDLRRWRPAAPSSTLGLRDGPPDSRLQWIDPSGPSVAITAFASGPRMIEVAARYADTVFFGLGADTERLRWGIHLARAACERAGRDPGELSFAAGMSVAVVEDLNLGRALVANTVASSARFSSMQGSFNGPASEAHREIYQAVAAGYDMNHHGERGSQVSLLTPDFIDNFAVVGSAQRCVERLRAIHELGIDDILIAPPRNDVDPADRARVIAALVDDVLPALRTR
ncbi:MAG: Luciferase-like, subgroup [Pseudonocardiales bacterium]|nr:Luciferase-like, subgroup [Pseudonocardiales bacterium]